jgi:hypothetical protein
MVIRQCLVACVVAAAVASAACGYTLAGRGSFLPETIKVIGIPNFVNRTPYPEVELVLTQRVRSELIGRGKYKVLPQETDVDAVLRGTINSLSIMPSAFDQNQQATRYIVTVSVAIQLVETKDNKVLWQNPGQVFREEYQLSTGAASVLDPAAFFGQASNALDRMATEFGRSVVSAILEAF